MTHGYIHYKGKYRSCISLPIAHPRHRYICPVRIVQFHWALLSRRLTAWCRGQTSLALLMSRSNQTSPLAHFNTKEWSIDLKIIVMFINGCANSSQEDWLTDWLTDCDSTDVKIKPAGLISCPSYYKSKVNWSLTCSSMDVPTPHKKTDSDSPDVEIKPVSSCSF